jgi:N-acetylglucosaminyl-diphospho-decaprenol L-rhamnosyltransferase
VISAVVVSYRSAALAQDAIASLRREAERAGLPFEAIAVVNSGDRAEAGALRSVADAVVEPNRNLGFAGGLNAGIRIARGETLVLANPDLVFLPGSLAALHEAVLGRDLVAAGPAFYWDEGEAIFHPPADEPRPLDLRRRQLARRDAISAERLFRRELRRVRSAYLAAVRGERRPASALRGALVAVSRRTLDAAGLFDENYALYYEENDWQHRFRAAGGSLVYVGGAHVIHRYNQSARLEPRSSEWFGASERRYFTTHFGEWGARALDEFSATPDRTTRLDPLPEGRLAWDAAGPTAIAISPSASFLPFLYQPLGLGTREWSLPPGLASGTSGSTWYARAFDSETGRVHAEGALPAVGEYHPAR